MPLPLDILSESRAREETLKAGHAAYLENHPEIQRILGDFVSAALVEQPLDVFEFARRQFGANVDMAKSNSAWPDLVGMDADKASAKLRSERPDLEVYQARLSLMPIT